MFTPHQPTSRSCLDRTVRLLILLQLVLTLTGLGQINRTFAASEPDLRLRPDDGAPGTTVLARGRNFPPNTAGNVRWDDSTVLATVQTDDAGDFEITFAIPAAPAGTHTVTAKIGDATATDSFTIELPEGIPSALTPMPATFPADAGSLAACSDATANISTADDLTKALESAQPGEVLVLADGVYNGQFVIATSGTEAQPITICGGRNAIIDGGGVRSGYAVHVTANWVNLEGITIRNAQKGVVADGSNHITLRTLEVHTIGDEAIHLRSLSSDNIVQSNLVHDTGLRRDKFGEGIYVGSAVSNWEKYGDGGPDLSDRNLVEANLIWATTAESIDIKEGTTGTIVRANWFDGSALSGADSWIDAKGNDAQISENHGFNSPLDGYQTHVIDNMDWGKGNQFAANSADVNGPGFGFSFHEKVPGDNTVLCNNVVNSAASGFANVDCIETSS